MKSRHGPGISTTGTAQKWPGMFTPGLQSQKEEDLCLEMSMWKEKKGTVMQRGVDYRF